MLNGADPIWTRNAARLLCRQWRNGLCTLAAIAGLLMPGQLVATVMPYASAGPVEEERPVEEETKSVVESRQLTPQRQPNRPRGPQMRLCLRGLTPQLSSASDLPAATAFNLHAGLGAPLRI